MRVKTEIVKVCEDCGEKIYCKKGSKRRFCDSCIKKRNRDRANSWYKEKFFVDKEEDVIDGKDVKVADMMAIRKMGMAPIVEEINSMMPMMINDDYHRAVGMLKELVKAINEMVTIRAVEKFRIKARMVEPVKTGTIKGEVENRGRVTTRSKGPIMGGGYVA